MLVVLKKGTQNLASFYDGVLIAQRIGVRNKDLSTTVFFKYTNSKHKYTEFTEECEGNDKRSFMDTESFNQLEFLKFQKFHKSVSRKPTFSGVLIH